MVLIPAGEFVMGTPASEIERLKALYNVKRDELFASEVPAHRVRLSAGGCPHPPDARSAGAGALRVPGAVVEVTDDGPCGQIVFSS